MVRDPIGAHVDLIFGMATDGHAYPDFPGQAQGALHSTVVGPGSLLEILESQLGLTGPHKAEAVRRAAYTAKLRAACLARPGCFFAASLAKDPWATTGLLLGRRDQLVEAGWPGTTIGANRVDDLAAAETAGPDLPVGPADRYRTVLASLNDTATLDLASLAVIGGCSLLPPPWRRLVAALAACGVTVHDQRGIETSTPASDLQRAQDFLATGSIGPLLGDGSLVLMEADTSLIAAEAIAEWLAAGTQEQLEGTVVLSPDGDTALLDAMLRARGLPALGQSSHSPWRGALQVLPLAFAIAWKPFNPQALLDLLLLPISPIGPSAARELAYALTQEPGTGADAWAQAWTRIDHELREQQTDGNRGAPHRAARLNRWRNWTTGGLFDRAPGMPAAEARAIATRVAAWANTMNAGAKGALFGAVAGAASALMEAIDVLGQDPLPGLLLDRMIEQVLTPGDPNPDHLAEAGGLRCVTHAGAIWTPAARVVWWDCKGPGERAPSTPWSTAELRALEASGCLLEEPPAAAARIAWGYANAVRMAGERLMLVCPSFSGGEETVSHPLAHQLDPLLRPAGALIRWRAEQLLQCNVNLLAGRTMLRRLSTAWTLPRLCARWTLPVSATDCLAGRSESATSFERLIECHLRWLLVDVLHLRRGCFAEIPSTNQLLGTLAHAIVRRVLLPGLPGEPSAIQAAVALAFDEFVPAIAAPLLQPEHAGDLAEARSRIPAAVAHLVDLLRQRNLVVVATEAARETAFAGGLPVKGRLDLLVRHPFEGLGVIDLKWTRSSKRRREEIVAGRALQLATYGAIADADSALPVPGAYYLLRQRQLMGERGSFVAEEELATARTLPDTWHDLVATWHVWHDLALSGTVLALGAEEAAAYTPVGVPICAGEEPCRYCEFTGLCRIGAEEV